MGDDIVAFKMVDSETEEGDKESRSGSQVCREIWVHVLSRLRRPISSMENERRKEVFGGGQICPSVLHRCVVIVENRCDR